MVICQETSTENMYPVYSVNITISEDSDWPSVRCFQCLNELSLIGEILASSPSEDEMDDDNSLNLEVILVSQKDEKAIQRIIGAIGDIAGVAVSDYPVDTP